MAESDWNYRGDVNLRHGGIFWREAAVGDMPSAVKVTPLADSGGPENMFRVQVGSIFVTDDASRLAEALGSAGIDPAVASREDVVLAVEAHFGALEADEDYVVRVGAKDPHWGGRGDMPEAEEVLRGGASFRKWLEREHLHAPEEAPAPARKM